MKLHSWAALPAMWLGAASIASAAPATPATGVDAIYAYAGTWKASIDRLETSYSKAGHTANTLHNDCWKSGAYLACRQIVNGDPKVLLVFTCRAGGHTCSSYQIPSDGAAPGLGALILNGNTWVFPWSVEKNGRTIYFRVLNIWSSPRTIEFRQEFSRDQIHWTKIASGHEAKVE
ncbi:MAG TPA: hypothetical protein VFA39_02060 [Steroidobacteraceae bacterium]|nr:hypothetical protein [Steroidobacteraceae bacterium]